MIITRVKVNCTGFGRYRVFPSNVVVFLNSASSAAALVFYLPGVCTHTDTVRKQRKARDRNILKSSKKIQYLMNTLYILSPNSAIKTVSFSIESRRS